MDSVGVCVCVFLEKVGFPRVFLPTISDLIRNLQNKKKTPSNNKENQRKRRRKKYITKYKERMLCSIKLHFQWEIFIA